MTDYSELQPSLAWLV